MLPPALHVHIHQTQEVLHQRGENGGSLDGVFKGKQEMDGYPCYECLVDCVPQEGCIYGHENQGEGQDAGVL